MLYLINHPIQLIGIIVEYNHFHLMTAQFWLFYNLNFGKIEGLEEIENTHNMTRKIIMPAKYAIHFLSILWVT